MEWNVWKEESESKSLTTKGGVSACFGGFQCWYSWRFWEWGVSQSLGIFTIGQEDWWVWCLGKQINSTDETTR